jgi:transcriptional regulator NrdR family protein
MHSEQERPVQEKSIEDSIQQIEQDLRLLNWQVSKVGKMIRTALQQAKIRILSPP